MARVLNNPAATGASLDSAAVGHIPEEKKPKWVLYFGAVGAFCLVLQSTVWARWLLSGPTRTPNGVTEVPTFFRWTTHSIEVVTFIIFLVAVYFMVWKPWRRDGELHWDGVLCFALTSMAWLDPYANFVKHYFWYNTEFINFGSWLNFLPFTRLPNAAAYPEPIIVSIPAYVWWDVLPIFGACALMRRLKERYGWGIQRQLWAGFIWLCATEFILETFFMRLGYYGYTSSVEAWTLDAGRYYQLPIFEGFMWGACMFLFALFRYRRDDKGRSFVERGVDDLHIGKKSKTFMRFLALSGAFNMAFIGLWIIPGQVISVTSDMPWPKYIQDRSYMNMGYCGVGTNVACPSPDVPTPFGEKSIYIDRNGNPVYPPGNSFAPKK